MNMFMRYDVYSTTRDGRRDWYVAEVSATAKGTSNKIDSMWYTQKDALSRARQLRSQRPKPKLGRWPIQLHQISGNVKEL